MATTKKNKKEIVSLDWTGVQGETPFYDFSLYDSAGGYGVAIDTKIINFLDPRLSSQQENFLLSGTNQILDFYNKARRLPSDVYAEIPTGVSGTYVPLRPSGTIKVLVTIPDIYRDSSSGINFNFSNLRKKPPRSKVGAYDEIQLNTYNFTQKAQNISKLLRKYNKQAKDFEGRVYGFNFSRQATKVKNVASLLAELVNENKLDYSEDQSDLLILGVTSSYLPIYGQINKGDGFYNLDYGFGQFQQSKFLDSNTMFIYKHFDKINQLAIDSAATAPAAAGSPSDGWQKFLHQYIMFPTASIEYTRGRPNTPEPDEYLKKEIAKANRQSVQSAATLEKLERNWRDPKFLQQIEQRQKASRDWVGDNVLGNLDKTIDQMHKLEDYYHDVLDKIGITYIVRAALRCLALDLPIGDIKKFLLDARNFTADVVKILKRPVIKLDDMIPTVDIMADLIKAVFWGVYEAVKKALWKMLKSIIYTLLDNCGDPCASFGGLDLGNLFSKGNLKALGKNLAGPALAGAASGLQAGNSGANAQKFLNNLDKKVTPDMKKTLLAPTAGAQQAFSNSPLGKFFNEASATLTCGETNKLLQGKASPAAIKIIKEIAKNHDLTELLGNQDDINNFFGNAGKVIDMDDLAAQIEEAEEFFPNPTGCLTDRQDNEFRCALLKKKGVSAEWCEQQASGSAERAKKRIDQLQTFLDDPSKTLQDTLPPIYCTYDRTTGELIEGIVPNDHPSFKFMMKTTLDTTFDGIYNAFTYDVLRMPDVMQLEVSDTEAIPRVVDASPAQGGVYVQAGPKLAEGFKMINPKFELAMREGYQVAPPFWRCPSMTVKEDGTPQEVIDFRNKTVEYNEPLPDLIKPINRVSFCPGMSPGADGEEGVYAQFRTGYLFPTSRIRTAKNMIARKLLDVSGGILQLSIDNTLKTDLQQYGPPGAVSTYQSFMNEISNNPLLREAMGGSNISNIFGPDRYALAYRQFNQAIPTSGRITKDKYSIRMVGDSAGSIPDAMIYEKMFQSDISTGSLRVIEERRLTDWDPTQDDSTKEKFFAQFLQKIWSEGENIYTEGATGRPVLASKPWYGKDFMQNDATNAIKNALIADQKSSSGINSLYEELLRDLLAECLTQIKDSKLLDPAYNLASPEGNVRNLFSLINFAPFPRPDCDLMLLELDTIKAEIYEKYKDALCIERSLPNVSGLGDNRDNAFETAALCGIVKTTVRTYAVEFVLKTLVTFSELQVLSLDELVIIYLREHLMGEIRAKGYLDNFMLQVLKAYNLLAADAASQMTRNVTDSLVALDWFIWEQLKYAVTKVLTLSGLQQNQKNILDLLIKDDVSHFSEGWLPDFDAGANIMNLARDSNEGPAAFHVETAAEILGIKDWTNGTLVLEKYVRAEPSNWGVTEVGGTPDPWWDAKKEEYTGVFSFKEFYDKIFGGRGLFRSTDPSRLPPLEPIRNIAYVEGRQWEEEINFDPDNCTETTTTIRVPFETPEEGQPGFAQPDIIGSYFSTLRYGLRLVCRAGDNTELEEVMDLRGNPSSVYDERIAQRNNSYLATDQFFSPDAPQGTVFPPNRLTFPIVCVEANMSAVRSTSLADKSSITTEYLRTQYAADYNSRLIRVLKNTDEFSFMFDYCFPLNRLISLCVLYNAAYVLPYPGLNDVFTNTKEQLRTTFLTLLKSGNYLYKDPHWSQKKMAINIANGKEIDGLDYGKMALQFLFGLLKGFGEAFSPNLAIARKVQMAARLIGPLLVKAVNKAKEIGNRVNELGGGSSDFFGGPITECDLPFEIPDLPILLISFGLLPMDVFIYPPGPPLTVLGLYYLPLFGFPEAPGNLILGLPHNEKEKLRCELQDILDAPELYRDGDAYCPTAAVAEEILRGNIPWGVVPPVNWGRGIYPEITPDEDPLNDFPIDEFPMEDENNPYADEVSNEAAGEEAMPGDIDPEVLLGEPGAPPEGDDVYGDDAHQNDAGDDTDADPSGNEPQGFPDPRNEGGDLND